MADETTNLQPTDDPAPATPETTGNSETPILAWEAKEFAEYSRNHQWYLVVGIGGAILTIGALIFQQWLMAVVFALATYVVIKHADDKPRELTYSITKLGINVGEHFHPYNELKLFWIIYKPPVKTLSVQTTNRFKPLIKIDLADVDPLAVKNTLKQYLPEEPKREEDILDKFSRFIRL